MLESIVLILIRFHRPVDPTRYVPGGTIIPDTVFSHYKPLASHFLAILFATVSKRSVVRGYAKISFDMELSIDLSGFTENHRLSSELSSTLRDFISSFSKTYALESGQSR